MSILSFEDYLFSRKLLHDQSMRVTAKINYLKELFRAKGKN
jgi:hypothetical protein